jgi:DNA repair exonuclease SbcCD ATPase subunit
MTKAELLAQNEDLWERVLGYEQTIAAQEGELTHASQQITQICEGMGTIAESNAQTRAMVEEVSDRLEGKLPESPGWWN